jgi:TRAP-type C4-dicarboxylate transport system substrate-binding protein
MKKIVSLVLILALVLMVFAACGGNNAGSAVTTTDNKGAVTTTDDKGNDGNSGTTDLYKPVEAESSDLVYTGPEMELVVNLATGENNVPYLLDGLRRVEERTDGKVKFVVHFSNSLLSTSEALNGLSSGVCDISDITLANYPSQFVYTDQVCSLPFMGFTDFVQGCHIIRNTVFNNELMMSEFTKNNIKPLMTNCVYGSPISFTKPTDITKPESLKGKKIMTVNRIFSEFASAYGGSGVFQPVPDMYSALSTGVVDGILMGVVVLDVFGALDVIDTIYRFQNDFSSSIKTTCINLDVWNSFDDTLKKIFEEEILSEKFFNAYVDYMVAVEDDLWKTIIEEKGIKVKIIDGEDMEAWINAIEPYKSAYIKNLYDQGYTEIYKAVDIWKENIAKYNESRK